MNTSETHSHRGMQVQFLYSLAILLSVPLQLFPAVRIMENGIFERSGKQSVLVKWQKNFFRFCCVVFCAALSYFGAADLDKFVSFVGSFAWYVIPLHAFSVCFTNLTHPTSSVQCAALLRLPADAALQGVRTYAQAEDGGYRAHDLWDCRGGLYNGADCSGTCFLSFPSSIS